MPHTRAGWLFLGALSATLAGSPLAAQDVIVVRAARMLDVALGQIVSPAVVTIQGDRIQSVGVASIEHGSMLTTRRSP
jgi:hypothetical protein